MHIIVDNIVRDDFKFIIFLVYSPQYSQAFIEAEHTRLKSDHAMKLKQSRENDAIILANEKELQSMKAALDQCKKELAETNQRGNALQNNTKQLENQLRSVTKHCDSLLYDRKQCGLDQQEVQKMELEKSSLRKEIEFCSKTARNSAPKPDQTVCTRFE